MGLFSELKKIDERKDEGQPVPAKKQAVATPLPNHETIEKSNCQLNAWITGEQNKLLDQIYFRLRGKGVKIKKGELIGIAIELLSRILENQSPASLDTTVLDTYIQKMVQKS